MQAKEIAQKKVKNISQGKKDSGVVRHGDGPRQNVPMTLRASDWRHNNGPAKAMTHFERALFVRKSDAGGKKK